MSRLQNKILDARGRMMAEYINKNQVKDILAMLGYYDRELIMRIDELPVIKTMLVEVITQKE